MLLFFHIENDQLPQNCEAFIVKQLHEKKMNKLTKHFLMLQNQYFRIRSLLLKPMDLSPICKVTLKMICNVKYVLL